MTLDLSYLDDLVRAARLAREEADARSADLNAEIARLYDEGASVIAMAARLGVGRHRVYERVRRHRAEPLAK